MQAFARHGFNADSLRDGVPMYDGVFQPSVKRECRLQWWLLFVLFAAFALFAADQFLRFQIGFSDNQITFITGGTSHIH